MPWLLYLVFYAQVTGYTADVIHALSPVSGLVTAILWDWHMNMLPLTRNQGIASYYFTAATEP
jgi:hypothetical protein